MTGSGRCLFITGKSKSFLLCVISQCSLIDCAGHPDSSFFVFADSRRGKFIGKDGSVTAFIDDYAPITTNGEIFLRSFRTSNCELLVQKCKSCITYRKTLRVLHSRWSVRNSLVNKALVQEGRACI